MKRHFYRDWNREHTRHWNYHGERYKIALALAVGWTARGMDGAMLVCLIAGAIGIWVAEMINE